jgi:hypothetical protein
MDTQQQFAAASLMTADNLRSIARSMTISQISRLSLPEIDAVVDQISRVLPAGNVPGVILSGLAKLTGRRPAPNMINRDINLLFRGVEQTLDKAVYHAFFSGPAAVIWGYQKMLQLAGKDLRDSFPEGVWQFYVNYALREDTARHANETDGFDRALSHYGVRLGRLNRLTAWTMAAIHTLHQYPALLENEWRERVTLATLRELTAAEPNSAYFAGLYAQWEKLRPYGRGADVDPSQTYPEYRASKFAEFLRLALRNVPPAVRQAWTERLQHAESFDLPAYKRQMSLLAYLEPSNYNETAETVALNQAHIALIWDGRYYLIPACSPQGDGPAEIATVRSAIAAIMASPAGHGPAQLATLAAVKRSALPGLRPKLRPETQQELATLRCAPIVINADQRERSLPLAELRLVERGTGDHALTLIDTGSSMVFDQSHIFFDGGWGAALAEIMTVEALAWAVYLNTLPAATPAPIRPYSPTLHLDAAEHTLIAEAPHISVEAGAESTAVNLKAILDLRKLFKRRSDLLNLTVNDLLVLFRAIHAITYKPAPDLVAAVQAALGDPQLSVAAAAAMTALEESALNPAILIPVDGSQPNPGDRLHPMTFEVPLEDLNIVQLHADALRLLEAARTNLTGPAWDAFAECQKVYLATLAGFGEVLTRAKDIALTGESTSSGAIRLLAHMPQALQRLLDAIPGRFDVLNDIIKGREVLSNLGVVAPSSSLVRFITAKDDNEKKTLAWGIITDAAGTMHVSLRDFRPHVGLFAQAGRRDLALRLTSDYLESYVAGLNRFISELTRITQGSHAGAQK